MVLGYFELPKDEQPPVEIWHHQDRLNEWFEAVNQRRDKGYESVPQAGTEEEGMTSNQLVKEALGEDQG